MTPVHYRGKVWCVRVPSGAFVARRNGKVFITGNSGFPKRVRLDLKIDQHFGKAAERPVIRPRPQPSFTKNTYGKMAPRDEQMETSAATPEAARFVGWDRALRPGWEPIIVAVKPLRGTVAANALRYGTGGLHVDACRLPRGDSTARVNRVPSGYMSANIGGSSDAGASYTTGGESGGYPPNVALDEEAAEALDRMSGVLKSGPIKVGRPRGRSFGVGEKGTTRTTKPWEATEGSEGGASRFFYVAKASSSERDAGLGDLPPLSAGERCDREDGTAGVNGYAGTRGEGGRNIHPTLKPIALMRWLCRLAAPPGAHDPDIGKRPVILDPFFGSGSTGVAALAEGLRVVGCEMMPEYVEIARRRCQHAYALPPDDPERAEQRMDTPGQKSLF